MRDADYLASIDHRAENYNCTCGDCDWSGDVDELDIIEGCSLTPGDPSPAGRCPECGTLAYPDEERDHDVDKARVAMALIRTVANMTEYKGNDTSDWQDAMSTLNSVIRKARKVAKG